MARRQVRLLPITDFTGGLNLRDDAFQLAANELPDITNVRILAQGGVERRQTVRNLNTSALTSTPKNIWTFYGGGNNQIVVQQGNDAAYSTGTATFNAINPDALTMTGTMRAATMGRLSSNNSARLYVQRNAEQVAWKWDGSAATVLADANGAYNDNLASPAAGRMPVARFIMPYLAFMFHGYIVQGASTFKNRIRWSHPGEPEDYRTNDFIDVEPDVDGDEITALQTFGERLYIFKRRSIHVLTGYSPDTFTVTRVATGIGAIGQESVHAIDTGLAFFDQAKGVFLIDTKGNISHLWEKLAIRLEDGTIPSAKYDLITLRWLNRRLYVSVPFATTATVNTRTFVFDPQVGRNGAWYAYDYGVGPMVFYRPSATDYQTLACSPSTGYVWKLESGTGATDNFGAGEVSFTPTFTTAWYDAGVPGVRKRWRRPVFVLDNEADTSVYVQVFRDYNTSTADRQFYVVTNADGAGMDWGDNWGGFWSASGTGTQAIERGSGLGRAYSVQMKVTGPTDIPWNINEIVLKYIVNRIR